MAQAVYPSASDRFWMEPGMDIPFRIDPYSLLALVEYGASKRDAIYQCICMRCGALHRLRRAKLKAMARAQKKRAKLNGTVWPPFSGHCPNCRETDVPSLTGAQFSLHHLNANGFSVLHWYREHQGCYSAHVGIYDPKGRLTEARPYSGKPWPAALDITGVSSALASADEMYCRLLAKLLAAQIKIVYSRDEKSVSLRPFYLPSGVAIR